MQVSSAPNTDNTEYASRRLYRPQALTTPSASSVSSGVASAIKSLKSSKGRYNNNVRAPLVTRLWRLRIAVQYYARNNDGELTNASLKNRFISPYTGKTSVRHVTKQNTHFGMSKNKSKNGITVVASDFHIHVL